MTPRVSLSFAAITAAISAILLAMVLRLPLPFDGFAAVFAAVLAFLTTFAIVAWLPARWVWSDAELLRFAFQRRHGLGDEAARTALVAITEAHDRANKLRQYAMQMVPEVHDLIFAIADRLDAAAREIFYTPRQQRVLRAVLVRSALIEEAALAHAKLRLRKEPETERVSREKLIAAADALDAAFDETNLLAAKGLLQDVSVASTVAERLLTPRGPRFVPQSDSEPQSLRENK